MENRKVYLNHHTNLLELEEHMYPLVDVETPNVFRLLFRKPEILLLQLGLVGLFA